MSRMLLLWFTMTATAVSAAPNRADERARASEITTSRAPPFMPRISEGERRAERELVRSLAVAEALVAVLAEERGPVEGVPTDADAVALDVLAGAEIGVLLIGVLPVEPVIGAPAPGVIRELRVVAVGIEDVPGDRVLVPDAVVLGEDLDGIAHEGEVAGEDALVEVVVRRLRGQLVDVHAAADGEAAGEVGRGHQVEGDGLAVVLVDDDLRGPGIPG